MLWSFSFVLKIAARTFILAFFFWLQKLVFASHASSTSAPSILYYYYIVRILHIYKYYLPHYVLSISSATTILRKKFFGPKLQRSVAFAKWKILFRYDDSIQSL